MIFFYCPKCKSVKLVVSENFPNWKCTNCNNEFTMLRAGILNTDAPNLDTEVMRNIIQECKELEENQC